MTPDDEKPYIISLRVPRMLSRRMKPAVEATRDSYGRKLSINDWIVVAIGNQLDGPAQEPLRTGPGASGAPPIPGAKRTAADLAASIPGVALGLGTALSGEAPVESEGSRFIRSLLSKTEGDANEDLLTRTQGEIPPGTMGRWYYDRHHRSLLAAWIDENHPQESR